MKQKKALFQLDRTVGSYHLCFVYTYMSSPEGWVVVYPQRILCCDHEPETVCIHISYVILLLFFLVCKKIRDFPAHSMVSSLQRVLVSSLPIHSMLCLQSSVRVIVRFRPQNKLEKSKNATKCIKNISRWSKSFCQTSKYSQRNKGDGTPKQTFLKIVFLTNFYHVAKFEKNQTRQLFSRKFFVFFPAI